MFHENAYTHPTELDGEPEAEESEALGNQGVKIPIKKTDDMREVVKMEIPD